MRVLFLITFFILSCSPETLSIKTSGAVVGLDDPLVKKAREYKLSNEIAILLEACFHKKKLPLFQFLQFSEYTDISDACLADEVISQKDHIALLHAYLDAAVEMLTVETTNGAVISPQMATDEMNGVLLSRMRQTLQDGLENLDGEAVKKILADFSTLTKNLVDEFFNDRFAKTNNAEELKLAVFTSIAHASSVVLSEYATSLADEPGNKDDSLLSELLTLFPESLSNGDGAVKEIFFEIAKPLAEVMDPSSEEFLETTKHIISRIKETTDEKSRSEVESRLTTISTAFASGKPMLSKVSLNSGAFQTTSLKLNLALNSYKAEEAQLYEDVNCKNKLEDEASNPSLLTLEEGRLSTQYSLSSGSTDRDLVIAVVFKNSLGEDDCVSDTIRYVGESVEADLDTGDIILEVPVKSLPVADCRAQGYYFYSSLCHSEERECEDDEVFVDAETCEPATYANIKTIEACQSLSPSGYFFSSVCHEDPRDCTGLVPSKKTAADGISCEDMDVADAAEKSECEGLVPTAYWYNKDCHESAPQTITINKVAYNPEHNSQFDPQVRDMDFDITDSAQFTFSIWLKIETATNDWNYSWYNETHNEPVYMYGDTNLTGDQIRIRVGLSDTTTSGEPGIAETITEWMPHSEFDEFRLVVFTFDASLDGVSSGEYNGPFRIYLDGELLSELSSSAAFSGDYGTLSSWTKHTIFWYSKFHYSHNIATWKTNALSAAQVLELYNGGEARDLNVDMDPGPPDHWFPLGDAPGDELLYDTEGSPYDNRAYDLQSSLYFWTHNIDLVDKP